MTKAKDAFNELLSQISLSDREEAIAILYFFFESKLNLTREAIMQNPDIEIAKIEITDVIHRINRHEPIQYITNQAWFRNHFFELNSSVLIPRPETEMIVDYIIQQKLNEGSRVLDVGTGSGCISISIKLEVPQAMVFALDVSNIALEVAIRNANRLNADVEFIQDDFLNSEVSLEPLDYIVSNPPYIMEKERSIMHENVLVYEPALALFVSDNEPLIFYSALATQGKKWLKPFGKIVAEINPLLVKQTVELFELHGYDSVSYFPDLEGKPRMIVASLERC